MLKKNALYILFLGTLCILAGIGVMIWASDKFYLGIAFVVLGLVYGLAGILLYRRSKKIASTKHESKE
ncbi:hypothetical protein CHH69_03230 [Terribacillus saccharophilus]|uniref:hypothetical protein n=1 Tax=Terribacillus saccharophilus TaxID=361277 RepID=UPI000BA4E81F|nr:hypothetical protein [Terribacillus saccharophilus]PAF19205.1 hypothetical protein CHH51_04020 [Terribacillus saccharophilus]PAF36703.1 hypothetical protein CHH58_07490 [Terribacillus saccharophilus]PAF40383.1 hypothetical protein CHH69_03230 [Terribacillus saccharophilus]